MIESAVKAMLGISVILGGWMAVQAMWARATGVSRSEDPLAGRLGCGSCDCRSRCKNEPVDNRS